MSNTSLLFDKAALLSIARTIGEVPEVKGAFEKELLPKSMRDYSTIINISGMGAAAESNSLTLPDGSDTVFTRTFALGVTAKKALVLARIKAPSSTHLFKAAHPLGVPVASAVDSNGLFPCVLAVQDYTQSRRLFTVRTELSEGLPGGESRSMPDVYTTYADLDGMLYGVYANHSLFFPYNGSSNPVALQACFLSGADIVFVFKKTAGTTNQGFGESAMNVVILE